MKCVYYFFLKKILNVFQKKWQTRADTRYYFFFPQKISKNGNKIQKSFKEFSEDFFLLTQWRRKKKSGWIQLNTLPLQFWSFYKWWLRIKKKGLFLFHTGALVVYKPHGYLWVQFFVLVFFFLFVCFSFFFSHIRRVGIASALLPYGHWVVLVWGRVAGITTTWTRSSNWTVVCGRGSWDLINHGAEVWKSKIGSVLWRKECRAALP